MRTRFSEPSFTSQDVIIARELGFAYGLKQIVHGLNLRVQKGERVAIYGANGCGKSTLLRLLMGELESQSGTIRIGPSIRYAYLPQVVTFADPARSVLETVRYQLREFAVFLDRIPRFES